MQYNETTKCTVYEPVSALLASKCQTHTLQQCKHSQLTTEKKTNKQGMKHIKH